MIHRTETTRWIILLLLTGFSIISYLQRMNISVAAKYMMPELDLSEAQMGQIFSSFMLGYALFQIPAGVLGDRFGPRAILTLAAVIWFATTLLTGLLPGLLITSTIGVFGSLLVIRFLLGIGVAATYPVAARTIANWMQPRERGVSNAIVIAGVALGSATTPPLVAWMMVDLGWRESFYISAGIALLIGILWRTFATDFPSQHPWVDKRDASIAGLTTDSLSPNLRELWRLLKERNICVIAISYFFEGYVLYVFVFWLYIYLVDIRGFSLLDAGIFAGLPWIVAAILTPIGGYWCDVLSTRFGRLTGSRINVISSYCVASTALVVGALAQDPYVAIAGLALSVGFLMSAEGAFWSSTIEIAGPHSGAATGLLNTTGNLGGVVSTALIPILANNFGWAFALLSSSAVALVGALAWLLVRSPGRSGGLAVETDSGAVSRQSHFVEKEVDSRKQIFRHQGAIVGC